MEKDDVIEFLENKLATLKEESPGAFAAIERYEGVINDIAGAD